MKEFGSEYSDAPPESTEPFVQPRSPVPDWFDDNPPEDTEPVAESDIGDEPPEEFVDASLTDTFNACREWLLEKSAEHLADLLHPGLGQLIHLGELGLEGFRDIAALDDPEAFRVLQVPLTKSVSGINIEVHIRLPGSEDPRISIPRIDGFVAPGDESLFGGWAIEKDESQVHTGRDAASGQGSPYEAQHSSNQHFSPTDTGEPPPELTLAVPPTWQFRRRKGIVAAVGTADLSELYPEPAPAKRAVVLRRMAQHFRDEIAGYHLYDGVEVIIINDPDTASGIWMRVDGGSSSDDDEYSSVRSWGRTGPSRALGTWPVSAHAEGARAAVWQMQLMLDLITRKTDVHVREV